MILEISLKFYKTCCLGFTQSGEKYRVGLSWIVELFKFLVLGVLLLRNTL